MIFLYPLLFSFLAFKYYKTKQKAPVTWFIVLYYFLSSVTANYLYYNNYYNDFENINITIHSVLYHFFCLFLFIEGFYQIEKVTKIEFLYVSFNKLFFLLILLLILSLISIYDSVNLLKKVYSLSINELRFAYNQRELYAPRTGMMISYLKGISNISFPICVFFFFYFSLYYPTKFFLSILWIIASLSIVVASLTIAGRDSIVQWIMMFVCNYFLFKPLMTKNMKRRILLIGFGPIIISAIIIVLISIQRFGENPKDLINSSLSYFGQGFINFSKYFELFHNGSFFGRMTFPALFPVDQQISPANLNVNFPNISFDLNIFATLIGDFYLDFGYLGTILLSILIFFFFLLMKYLYSYCLINYFLFIFILQILICGVFWFMQSSPMFQKIFSLILLYSIYKKFKFDYALSRGIK